eukprot:CAMPEP_0119069730 /NCGR_PEP_ID=MMETSP1178-20130426/28773_1 /TAXON_ID=33656 /ORGANISM="unid sp, Strain CCMP2000" /LENGTH=92 /DNA_ID=CAMNT_0007051525 /DNA_START=381 /DNA_END=659 /DNA_ORIENTATION=-
MAPDRSETGRQRSHAGAMVLAALTTVPKSPQLRQRSEAWSVSRASVWNSLWGECRARSRMSMRWLTGASRSSGRKISPFFSLAERAPCGWLS